MAGDKEISEIVKKCKVLLLDIEGTTTSISFVKDKLFPYAEENVKQFLADQWETDSVKEVILALRKLSLDDKENSVDGVVDIPGDDATKEDQIDGVVKSVKWMMSLDRKAGPLKQLQGLIWERGYDQGDIKGHVYDDVSPALEQWHSVDGQKIYIYSSGSVHAQKLLFGRSLAGDLLRHVDGHFDTAVGAKQEKDSYSKIVEQIGCKAEDVLFLTDIEKEAQAAREAGLNAALVTRDGNAPLSKEAATCYPIVTNFNQLTATYKRKQETQDEQPAKIARTEIQDEVKKDIEAPPMETEAKKEEPKEETPAVIAETVVEEITDSSEAAGAAEVDIEPVVTEETLAEQEKVVEDQEMAEKVQTFTEEVKEEKVKTTITVTEVGDEEKVEEVSMEPVVEEPNVEAEMVELHNVGEVLEKECDEILSKVQCVTNLDNITVKPMLDPIVEDAMDDENTDTSDLVDNILNTEEDMEKKSQAERTEKEQKPIEVTEAPEIATDRQSESTKKEEKLIEVTEAPENTTDHQSESTEKEAKPIEATEAPENTTDYKSESTEKEAKPIEVPEATENTTDHTNGNTTKVKLNGNAINGNGDSNDSDSRLDEVPQNGANGNGDTKTNGEGNTESNGNGKEIGQGDCKEVADIIVKTVGEEVQPETVTGTAEA